MPPPTVRKKSKKVNNVNPEPFVSDNKGFQCWPLGFGSLAHVVHVQNVSVACMFTFGRFKLLEHLFGHSFSDANI